MSRGVLTLLLIFLLLFGIFYPLIIQSDLISSADSSIQTFHDGTTEKSIKISNIETSFYLEIPIQAEVIKANLNISVEKYKDFYPLNPRLRISNTQDWLWRYQGTGYGAFGKQYSFITGDLSKELVYDGSHILDDTRIYLPATAQIESAYVNITGTVHDYWNKSVQQLNLEPDGAGDYEPEMLEFQNRLYVVYRTYYDEVTNGSDSDIVITSSLNGINWTNPLELTSAPDSLPPYNDTGTSADWRPTLEKFNNRLYCAWESNSTVTSGLDHDILLRSSSDGNTWGAVINITDQWENYYSNNTGLKNDWTVDMTVFNNSIWLIWATNNTGNESGFKSPIGDIMLSSSSDGQIWNQPYELTAGDDWATNDLSPKLAVFNNTLYAVWVSNNSKFTEGDERDYDIVYRTSTDGQTWSELKLLNPHDNNLFTHKGAIDTRPVLTTFDNKLICAWMSAASYTHGTDMDIYLRYTEDGSFTELGFGGEVTDSDNELYDHSPSVIGIGDRIYVAWVEDFTQNDILVESEIFANYYDLSIGDFGFEQQLNPPDNDGFDYWPKLGIFNDIVYAVWDSNDTKTGTGRDRDIILTNLEMSKPPLKFGMDIGGDNIWDISKDSLITSTKTKFDLAPGLNSVLSNNSLIEENSKTTSYGYKVCEIPLNIWFSGPEKITLDDLEIIYNSTLQVSDLSANLNSYISQNLDKVTKNDTVLVPFSLTSDSTGKVKVKDVEILLNYRPTIQLLSIPAAGKNIIEPVYRISWSDFDPDDDAVIELYYDTDAQGFDGMLIAGNISEDDNSDHFDWPWWKNEALRAGGNYYLYAKITDGVNDHYNYSQGPIRLQRVNIKNFLNITILEPDGLNDAYWDSVDLRWRLYAPERTLKLELFYDNDNLSFNGQKIDIDDDGQITDKDHLTISGSNSLGSLSWNLSVLNPGSSAYIYAKITDQWNISIFNYSSGPVYRLHMPAPKNFTLINAKIANEQILVTHERNPKLSWEPPFNEKGSNISISNLEYVLRVWRGTDNTGVKIYELETENTEVTIKPTSPLIYGNTYYSEVYAKLKSTQNESMKSFLSFRLENNLPSAPVIKITPEQPKTNSDLICSIMNQSLDEDGDTVQYIYHWFKNGVKQNYYDNSTTIPASATAKGERWSCKVLAFDTIGYGGNGTSEVIIRNSAPSFILESPKTDNEYSEDDIITFKFTVTDPDLGDAENLQYIVFDQSNDQSIKTGYVQTGAGTVEFTKKFEKGNYNIKINVTDDETGSEIFFTLKIKESEPETLEKVVLPLFIGIVLIIIILVIIFLFLFSRVQSMKKELPSHEPVDEQVIDEEMTEPKDELLSEDEMPPDMEEVEEDEESSEEFEEE